MSAGEDQLRIERRILRRSFSRWLLTLLVVLAVTAASLFWVLWAVFNSSSGLHAVLAGCAFLVFLATTIVSLFFVIGTAGDLLDHRDKHGRLKRGR